MAKNSSNDEWKKNTKSAIDIAIKDIIRSNKDDKIDKKVINRLAERACARFQSVDRDAMRRVIRDNISNDEEFKTKLTWGQRIANFFTNKNKQTNRLVNSVNAGDNDYKVNNIIKQHGAKTTGKDIPRKIDPDRIKAFDTKFRTEVAQTIQKKDLQYREKKSDGLSSGGIYGDSKNNNQVVFLKDSVKDNIPYNKDLSAKQTQQMKDQSDLHKEAVFDIAYKIFLPTRTPKIQLVTPMNKNESQEIRLISRGIEKFQTLNGFISDLRSDLMEKTIALNSELGAQITKGLKALYPTALKNKIESGELKETEIAQKFMASNAKEVKAKLIATYPELESQIKQLETNVEKELKRQLEQKIEGFEKISAMLTMLGEQDGHNENLGVIPDPNSPGKYQLQKIDHGRSGGRVFTTPEAMIAAVNNDHNEFGYNNMPNNITKFQEALEQATVISDEHVRDAINTKTYQLQAIGATQKDLYYYQDTDPETNYKKSKDTSFGASKDPHNQFKDFEEHYSGVIIQNKKIAGRLANALEIVKELMVHDMQSTTMQSGEWMRLAKALYCGDKKYIQDKYQIPKDKIDKALKKLQANQEQYAKDDKAQLKQKAQAAAPKLKKNMQVGGDNLPLPHNQKYKQQTQSKFN